MNILEIEVELENKHSAVIKNCIKDIREDFKNGVYCGKLIEITTETDEYEGDAIIFITNLDNPNKIFHKRVIEKHRWVKNVININRR